MPRSEKEQGVVLGLNAVITAVTSDHPRVLTVRRAEHALASPESAALDAREERGEAPDALPFGPLEPDEHRTLELGLRAWVREQTGIDLGYVEQLYTFGDRNRRPLEDAGGPRVVSVAYLALVREGEVAGAGEARWCDAYAYLPWEDWRQGRPRVISHEIAPRLEEWFLAVDDRAERARVRERIELTFGLGATGWDPERALERYELLYEAGLVHEARRDRVLRARRRGLAAPAQVPEAPRLGRSMTLDHRRILATALGRLRGKLKYRPVVFELLPPAFTLLQLQRTVEAMAGVRLHKQNFRRLVERGGLVEGTGRTKPTRGRPAELFRFRREVLRERLAPGVGLPGVRP